MSRFQDAIKQMRKKREKTAKQIGTFVQADAKIRTPVKTGHLRRMLTHEVESDDKKTSVYVGSDVEYGAAVEKGVPSQGIKAQPHIVPAIEENVGEIKNIIKKGLNA